MYGTKERDIKTLQEKHSIVMEMVTGKSRNCDGNSYIVTDIRPSKFHWSQIQLWRSISNGNTPVTIICDRQLWWKLIDHKKIVTEFATGKSGLWWTLWRKLWWKSPSQFWRCTTRERTGWEYLTGTLWRSPSQIVAGLGHNCRSTALAWPSFWSSAPSVSCILTKNCDGFRHICHFLMEFCHNSVRIRQKLRQNFWIHLW